MINENVFIFMIHSIKNIVHRHNHYKATTSPNKSHAHKHSSSIVYDVESLMIYWCVAWEFKICTKSKSLRRITKSDFYLFLWLHFLNWQPPNVVVAWHLFFFFFRWFLSLGWDWNTEFYFIFVFYHLLWFCLLAKKNKKNSNSSM